MYVCVLQRGMHHTSLLLTVRYKGDSLSAKVNPKQPDNDPMDYKGHGTHVAGIIAGENEWQVLPLFPTSERWTSLRKADTQMTKGSLELHLRLNCSCTKCFLTYVAQVPNRLQRLFVFDRSQGSRTPLRTS